MAPNDNRRIYRHRRPFKLIAGIIAGIAVFFLALLIFLFFYFQRYIVPVEDGIKLEVPWLEETVISE